MKTIFKITLAALSAAAAFSGAQAAENYTLKVHHFLGARSIQHTTMLATWCENIKSDSQGRLTCEIYPSMQLGGKPPQLYNQARDGVADVVWTVAGLTRGRFPQLEVFELPFMMTNAEATSRAAWDYSQQYAKDVFKDVHLLAVHVHGPGLIFTRDKPVKTLEDFRGLKLRAPTRLTGSMLSMLGATPVGMPVPAVTEALSKGVIDGAIIPFEIVPQLKVQELTKFTAQPMGDRALYTTVFIVPMNKAKYESLPKDLQQVIDKNSGREFSAFLGKTQADNDVPGEKVVRATSGMTINEIPASELAHWEKTLTRLNADWIKEMDGQGLHGQQLVDGARALIAKYTK